MEKKKKIDVYDTIDKKYILQDVIVADVMKKIGVTRTAVAYALCTGCIMKDRYRIEDDEFTMEIADEWDRYRKKLRKQVNLALLAKVKIKEGVYEMPLHKSNT